MSRCRDCKGWGFAGMQSYREPFPREAGNPPGFAPEFTPLRACDSCGGRGEKPERGEA